MKQQPDAEQALNMLQAFASVGVTQFDLTLTDLTGQKTGFQSGRFHEELCRTIATGWQLQPSSNTTS